MIYTYEQSCSKICFIKLSLGQILFIYVHTKSKKSCDQNFFHKIKIAQNVGFPHRFSFSGQKVTPMGLPDASGPPLAFGPGAWSRMGQESQRMTSWDTFRSHHVCPSFVLVCQDFCTFLAQPSDAHL